MPPAIDVSSAPPILSDGVVTLRAPRAEDADDILLGCTDPQAQMWTTIPVPYARSDAEAWLALRATPEQWWAAPVFAVTLAPDDRWSGNIDVRLDGQGGGDIGFLLAPWARGHGHATRMIRLACTWAFSTLGVSVITWSAFAGNEASRRSARSAGFRVPDVVLRRHLAQRGERRDAWVGDLLPDDVPAGVRHAEARYRGPALTNRELVVLGRLARGESHRQVAESLGISENTVKNHVRSILEKLQAKSRAEAVVIGLRGGLVTIAP